MANNDHLPLDDLSIFLSVCETAGFRKTATRLGLSASSVSEKIAALEARLGVALLNRTTRSVSLTEEGRALAARLTPLMRETRSALLDAANSRAEVRGLLKLNVTGAVMVDILPPLIDRFLGRFPQVSLEIIVEDRLVDITAAGCDAGIRYGEHLALDMISVPIGPPVQRLALAASPRYLKGRPLPSHPHDLLAHECIRLRFSSGALTAWEFSRGDVSVKVDPPGRLIIGVDAAQAAIDLARAGHGLLCTFENWLVPALKTGELQPVLPEWWSRFEGPRLYFPSRRMSAPLRAFVDLIRE